MIIILERVTLAELKVYAKEGSKHIQDGCSWTRTRSWAGYLAIERAKTGKHKILGLDISKDFIEIARKNAKKRGVEVAFRPGDVIDIPFSNNVFGFIIWHLAFKNLKEPFKALNQMYGVLRSDSYKNSSQNRVNFEGRF